MAVRYTSNIDLIKQQYLSSLESATEEIGVTGTAELQSNCPVGVYPKKSGRTGGTLRRSLTFNKSNSSNKYIITFGSSIDYAPYPEFKGKSKGWMRNTMRDFSSEARTILQKHLRKVGK